MKRTKLAGPRRMNPRAAAFVPEMLDSIECTPHGDSAGPASAEEPRALKFLRFSLRLPPRCRFAPARLLESD